MSLLSEIFTDIFARQENWLVRFDPRAKLVVALGFLIAVIFSSNPLFPIFTFILCVATTLRVGVPLRLVALRMAAPMGIAAILFLLQLFLSGSISGSLGGTGLGSGPAGTAAPLWHHDFHGFQLVATREGALAGIQLAARVLGSMSVVVLLGAVTPAHRIFAALRALGFPQGWVEIALLMYRYVFVLLDIAGDLTAAQRVRLGYSNFRRGLSSVGIVTGTLLLRSVDQAVRTHEAMQTRGCRGPIPLGPLPAMPRRDFWLACAGLVALSCIFAVMEIKK